MNDRKLHDEAEAGSKHIVVEETLQDGVNSPEESGSAKPKRKIKKWPIVTGALIVVVAAGIGGFIWHEQPAFCGAICHTPMDAYLATFESEPGVAGTDKWGNAVENTSGMLSVTHNAHGKTCLNCHEPTIGEQINEGIKWVSGDYVFPLEEHTLTDLTAARGATADEFCLNDSCHHLASDGTVIKTRADLEATTAHLSRNPHVAQHQEFDCGTCHKAHRSSVMYCSSCHADSEIPAGWVSGQEELTLSAAR